MVVAGVGEARRANEPTTDRRPETTAGVDLAACLHGGDRRDQEEREQCRQADMLDARRAAIGSRAARGRRLLSRSPVHAATLGGMGARVARTLSRFSAGEVTGLL